MGNTKNTINPLLTMHYIYRNLRSDSDIYVGLSWIHLITLRTNEETLMSDYMMCRSLKH